MKIKTGLVSGMVILLLAVFGLPSIKAEIPGTPECATGLIYGRVLCLDGTPIQGAYVQVRYWCVGEDLASLGHLIHTLTNSNGCYRFTESQFEGEVDYGWVRATHGITKTSPPFTYVPFSWTFHFLCGHFIPHDQIEVEVNQSASQATAY